MQRYWFHFMFGACFGIAVTLLCLASLRFPTFEQITGYINFVPVTLASRSQSYGVHQPLLKYVFLALIFLQWFVVGCAFSALFHRRGRRNDAA